MELPVQRDYLAAMRRGRTAEATAAAREADKASHAELNRLRARPCNAECFDCTATKPGWAVLPHGIFVCIDCAQVHRSLGRHISQTKAVNTGTYLWFPHELAVMREVGNGVAARAWAAAPPKPSRGASATEKTQYATAKYVDRQWGPAWPSAASPPPSAGPDLVAAAAPSVNAPVAPPAKPPTARAAHRGSTGLQGARRQITEAGPGPMMGDLIAFDAAEPQPEPQPEPPREPQQPSQQQPAAAAAKTMPTPAIAADGGWSNYASAKDSEARGPLLPRPSWAATNADDYDAKRQSVLAKFATTPPPLHNGHTAAPPHDNDAFFARFGL